MKIYQEWRRARVLLQFQVLFHLSRYARKNRRMLLFYPLLHLEMSSLQQENPNNLLSVVLQIWHQRVSLGTEITRRGFPASQESLV